MDKKPKTKINPNEYGGLLFDKSEVNAVKEVLLNEKIFRYSGRYETKTDKFELMAKEFFNKNFALGLNNGTSALKAALFSIGINKNDRVLISSYTFIATAAAVVALGAIPVPIDFNLENCMDLDDLKDEIKKGCKAIIPTHLQGRSFNLRPIIEIARAGDISVIEDSCQAFGAKNGSTFAGCFGDIGVFSFQQNKQITCGEGGLIVTDNPIYYEIARNYADHGVVRGSDLSWDKENASIGDNLRMNNIQAAILNEQLRKFKYIKDKQRKNRDYIFKQLEDLNLTNIVFSDDPTGDTGMNILFLINTSEIADLIIQYAKARLVEFRYLWHSIYYNFKVMKDSGFHAMDLKSELCSISEDTCRRLLSLSIPPTLAKEDLDELVVVIKEIYKLRYIQ